VFLFRGADSFIANFSGVESVQITTPANPAAGRRKLYAKSDGWYGLDSAGVETGPFGTGGGGGSFIGLSDTPGSYASQAGRFPVVNAGATALEFPAGLVYDASEGSLRMSEVLTPSTPPAGTRKIYPKSDGWYGLDSSGVERLLDNTPTAAGAGTPICFEWAGVTGTNYLALEGGTPAASPTAGVHQVAVTAGTITGIACYDAAGTTSAELTLNVNGSDIETLNFTGGNGYLPLSSPHTVSSGDLIGLRRGTVVGGIPDNAFVYHVADNDAVGLPFAANSTQDFFWAGFNSSLAGPAGYTDSTRHIVGQALDVTGATIAAAVGGGPTGTFNTLKNGAIDQSVVVAGNGYYSVTTTGYASGDEIGCREFVDGNNWTQTAILVEASNGPTGTVAFYGDLTTNEFMYCTRYPEEPGAAAITAVGTNFVVPAAITLGSVAYTTFDFVNNSWTIYKNGALDQVISKGGAFDKGTLALAPTAYAASDALAVEMTTGATAADCCLTFYH